MGRSARRGGDRPSRAIDCAFVVMEELDVRPTSDASRKSGAQQAMKLQESWVVGSCRGPGGRPRIGGRTPGTPTCAAGSSSACRKRSDSAVTSTARAVARVHGDEPHRSRSVHAPSASVVPTATLATKEAIRLSSESARLIGRGIVGPTRDRRSSSPATPPPWPHSTRSCASASSTTRSCGSRSGRRTGASSTPTSAELDRSAVRARRGGRRGDRLRRQSKARSATSPSRRTAMSSRSAGSSSSTSACRRQAGERVLVEAYQRFGGISAGGKRLWLAFAPTMLGAIALLWLSQAPLAWSLASRLRAGAAGA